MTPTQVALVQGSWKRVTPIAEQAAELLYGRLFELERLESLVPVVQGLGRRHAGDGVEDRHYATVEAALMWTLEKGLGVAFSTEVEEAWRTAYAVLATTMKEAANATESAAS